MIQRSKWKGLVVGLVVSLLVATTSYGSPSIAASETTATDNTHAIRIGAVLPLTGDLSSKGAQIRTALAISVADVNTFMEETKQSYRVEIDFRDSHGSPDEALRQAQSLYAEGTQLFVVGSSAELEKVKPWSDAHDVIVVSYSSSAPSLGVAADSIFRVVPDDQHQADALAHVLADQGVKTVLPVYRDDVYGQEMVALFAERFPPISTDGVILPAISYEPDTSDFAPIVKRIEEHISASERAVADTAILLVAFEEATELFAVADRLQGLRWYGTETLTLNTIFGENERALQFAQKVGFTGVSYGLVETSYYYTILQRIEAEIQHYVMPNAIFAYDIPWLFATILPQLNNPEDVAELRARFVALSEQFIGATGWVVLNEAGDRKYSDFDIWQLQTNGEASYWAHMGTYLRNPGYDGYIHWEPQYAPDARTAGAYLLGFEPTAYDPLRYVYRDEFIYMLMHALHNGTVGDADDNVLTFTDDARIDTRALASVRLAVKEGIVRGYGNDTLGPNRFITRAEMLTMIGRAVLPSTAGTLETNEHYSDADLIPAWAWESIMGLVQAGFLDDEQGTELGPYEPIMLAEATALCINILHSKLK